MDILPTAIDAAGGNLPTTIDGKSLLPLITSKDNTPVHPYLMWSGLHSYKWGYLITKSTKDHGTETPFAPPAWVFVKDDYLLRYTGILEKGVYKDFMEGREAIVELYNIKNDPAELKNIADAHPTIVKELSTIYFEESKDFTPPSDWKKSKWEELKDSKLFK